MGDALLLPVGGQAQNAAHHAVFYLVVHAQLYIVLHAQVVEQADILEGAGHAQLIHLDGAHALGIVAVHHDGAPCGLVDLGEKIEDGGLAGAVRADETRYLRAAYGEVEVVHGGEAAEVYAQMPCLQHRGLPQVPLGDI